LGIFRIFYWLIILQLLQFFFQLLEIDPDFVPARINLGNSLTEIERYDEAEEQYEKAVELRPDDPRNHYNYAIFLRKMEKYDEVLSSFGTCKINHYSN